MRVSKDYYSSERFDRPEVVQHIVQWCCSVERENVSNIPVVLIAKRIKSLCLKNYAHTNSNGARFCEEWEEHPEHMFKWIYEQFPNGRCRLVRRNRNKNFESSNIILKPLD